MNFFKSPPCCTAQNGSALLIILITIALFAALSFVIAQQTDSEKHLSSERIRLLASDIIDAGNKMSDTVAQLRLRGIKIDQISFENGVVSGYNNAACTTGKCKIFASDGGARDWETPTTEMNGGIDWSFTGDLAIEDMGTTDADLVAIVPKLSLDLCNYINKMLGLTESAGPPPSFSSVAANKFTGAFSITPYAISSSNVRGKKSGCVALTSSSGTAFTSFSGAAYAYYHVLEAR